MRETLPLPAPNTDRYETLHRWNLLDAPGEEAFDRLTRLAARVLSVPIALISIVDEERQFFKSSVGLPDELAVSRQVPLSHSFCRHVVASGHPLFVDDARSHSAFRTCAATKEWGVTSYAGVPLVTTDGMMVGAFCAVDLHPRIWTPEEMETMADLAAACMQEIETRRVADTARRVEAELRGRDGEFRTLADNAPDIIARFDLEGRHTFVNHALQAATGRTAADFVGKTLDEAPLPPEWSRWFLLHLNRVIASATPQTFEFDHIAASSARHYESRMVPEIGTDGCITGVLCVTRDLTPRKRVENGLRESEQRYRRLVEQSPEAIIVQTEGRIAFMNTRALALLEAETMEQVAGRLAGDFVAEETRGMMAERFERLAKGEALPAASHTIIGLKGRARSVEAVSAHVTYAGQPSVQTVLRDVTERLLAEEAARAEVELLNNIVRVQQETQADAQDVSALAQRIVDQAAAVTQAPGAGVGFLDGDTVEYRAGFGDATRFVGLRVPTKDSVSGESIAEGRVVWIRDARTDARLNPSIRESLNIGSLVTVPLRHGATPIGALTVYSRQPDAFTERHVHALELLAGFFGSALKNASAFEEKERALRERTAAMDALSDSLARHGAVLETAVDAIVVFDAAGCLMDWNPAAERIFGYRREDALGQDVIALLVPPSFRAAHRAGIRRYMTTGKGPRLGERLEIAGVRADGAEFPVELTVTRIPGAGPASFVGYIRDITDRKRAEAALLESKERFRSLFENAAVGLYRTTPDGRLLMANPALIQMLGFSSLEEMAAITMETGTGGAYAENGARAAFAEQMKRDGRVAGLEAAWLRADRSVVYVRESASAVRGPNGDVLFYEGSIEDISERKIAEEALRDSEAHFRQLFRDHPHPLWVFDRVSLKFLQVNDAAVQQYGYSRQEFLGMTIRDIRPESDVAALDDDIAAHNYMGLRHAGQWKHRAKDGRVMDVEITSHSLGDGGTDSFLVTARDVTEQKRAEAALRESEARFRHVWKGAADGMRITDENGVIVMVNDAFCQMVNMTEKSLVGRPYAVVYEPNGEDPKLTILKQRMRERSVPTHFEREVTLWNGRRVCLEASNSFLEVEGEPLLLLSNFRDVTERKRADEALRRYRLLAEHVSDIMLFVRRDDTILEANVAAERAYGFTREELRGMRVQDLYASAAESAPGAAVAGRDGQPLVFEAAHRRRNGETFPVEVTAQSQSANGEQMYLCVVRDVTERKAFEKQLAHQALHDTLTGLPNRVLLMDRLERSLAVSAQRGGKAALLVLDLDRFQVVNDSLGHPSGDQLLTEVAARLKSAARDVNTAARLAGDEFAVLLDDVTDEGEAIRFAERLLHALEAPFEINGQEVFASASIGIALSGERDDTAEDLLRDADIAMYKAKTGGKARWAAFQGDMSQNATARLELETDLRHAVGRGEFQLYYQPIVQMETGATVGVEALARWRHPRLGLMSPDAFVPIQEQIGLIEPFTIWVLKEAQRQCREWHRQGFNISVSVNLSVKNLLEAGFADNLAVILRETGFPAESLKLEITESAMMTNPERAMDILTELNRMGIRMSVDDFGTGYSSLAYLKQLPVHEIKIDKSFVMGMDADSDDDAAIVRATIDMAHNLRKKVVAEGVESQGVWRRLAQLGCDAAQGYHMGRPMPAADLNQWLGTSPYGLRPTL